MVEVVGCPKCDGKMVPLSQEIYPVAAKSSVLIYAEWRCVKCGYSVKA